MTGSIHHKTQTDKFRHYLNPLHIRSWLRPIVGKFLARIIAQGYQALYNTVLN